MADDHVVVREGLRVGLADYDDLLVCGMAEDGATALSLSEELLPDLVVMDLSMPLVDGLEATRRIVEKCPDTDVLVLSGHRDRAHVRDALDAGAKGYVVKGESLAVVVEAIRSVLSGQSGLSPVARAALPG